MQYPLPNLKTTKSQLHFCHLFLQFQLPEQFQIGLWEQIIHNQTPHSFKKLNKQIFYSLLHNQNEFRKYFSAFYHNHVKMYHWYLLEKKYHWTIGQYICKWIIEKSLSQYIKEFEEETEKMKEKEKNRKLFLMLTKNIKQDTECRKQEHVHRKLTLSTTEQNSSRKSSLKMRECSSLTGLAHQIFNYFCTSKSNSHQTSYKKRQYRGYESVNGKHKKKQKRGFRKNSETSEEKFPKQNDKNRNIFCSAKRNISGTGLQKSEVQKSDKKSHNVKFSQRKLEQTEKRGKKQDFHDLYLKTFHACQGFRYIFYNYEKHMQGLKEKQKYNLFIRQSAEPYSNLINSLQLSSNEQAQWKRKQNNQDRENSPKIKNQNLISSQKVQKPRQFSVRDKSKQSEAQKTIKKNKRKTEQEEADEQKHVNTCKMNKENQKIGEICPNVNHLHNYHRSCESESLRGCYEFIPVGNNIQKYFKDKEQGKKVIFRRIKNRKDGKFIRK